MWGQYVISTCDLVSPAKPADKTYAQLVDITTKHFNPTPSVSMYKHKFNSRDRSEEESIANYVAALRKLSEHCQFGDALNDMLRDRIVTGVKRKKLQQRLLSEPDLTFDKCMKIARTMEAAEKDTQHLKGDTNERVLFCRVERNPKNGGTQNRRVTWLLACHKKGHIAKKPGYYSEV